MFLGNSSHAAAAWAAPGAAPPLSLPSVALGSTCGRGALQDLYSVRHFLQPLTIPFRLYAQPDQARTWSIQVRRSIVRHGAGTRDHSNGSRHRILALTTDHRRAAAETEIITPSSYAA